MSRLFILAALASSVLAAATPASAQSEGEKVNMVIVYGEDECPQSKADEITVCARKGENERYRIPEPLRASPSPSNDAWNNKVLAYEVVGKSGTMSCSPVGAGGSTGCTQQLVQKAYAEKAQDPGIRFGELIAAEREKRLSTIDADASAMQGRVEEEERKYDERKRAEQAGTAPAQPASSPSTPPAGQ